MASTEGVIEHLAQRSPRLVARLAGLFELLEGLGASGQVLILPMLIVSGDAAATASRILDNEGLLRAAAAISLVDVLLHLAWGLLLYELLKVVDGAVAVFAMSILILGCALQAVAGILLFAPLAVLGTGSALGAFTTPQLDALAFLSLRWNAYAYDIFLAFFGFWLIVTGYLVFRSGFLPRIIGALLVVDGLGWSLFLSPALGISLFPLIAAGSGLGELPLIAWLLIRGVDVGKYKKRAAAFELVPERAYGRR